MEVKITKEEFVNWKENPTTQAIIEQFKQIRETYSEALCNGATLTENCDIDTAKAVGFIRGLNAFILVEYEEEEPKIEYAY